LSANRPLPLLSGLEGPDDEALSAICVRRSLRRGESLDPQDGATPGVMVLRSGLMRVSAGDAEGDGVLAGLIGAGDVHGLEAALTGRASSHTAVALTDVVGFAAEASRLRRLASERPGLALALAGAAAAQMGRVQDELACQARHRIEQRQARLLLGLQRRLNEGGLLLTQDELSQMLAVQRTTVTMLANRLKEAGLIAYARGRIRILDLDGLSRLACGCPLS
jgi:CRP-like cAMP-binding protein